MAIFGRISTVVKAKISRLLDRVEQPGEILDYGYEKQHEQLQRLRRGIADLVTAKSRLQRQQATLEQKLVKLDTQARQAVAAGHEDLARAALERKQLAQSELRALDGQVEELEGQRQKLTDSEQQLRARIEAFRTRKEVIKAQYSAAEAQVRISEAAAGVGAQMADVGMALQRAIDKTDGMQARAAALGELEAAGVFDDLALLGPGKDDIDLKLEQLGARGAVDEDLARIRAELGAASAGLISAHGEEPPSRGPSETAGS